nr:PREDICTED: astacin-like metalloendopeptidase isoform X1 [Latimeria chalumnae]XP_014347713.1 PREDICTED: astacin-like metalloendopeptidase isoform X1 [Latimeria chalumnae]XP_014347714.1 PREDICTED: astacin-like metalloendopeptidase isoform X1 [Latimeria chalumnae]|eukprot:XP_014347712.1 PREDICTED: astacin-like metalloendopeptidase isoform X1 [Latimeria chalumnae]
MSLQVLLILAALFCYSLSQTPTPTDRIKSKLEDEVSKAEAERANSVFGKILKANNGSGMLFEFGDIAKNTMRSAISCPSENCYWPKDSDGFVKVPYELSNKYTSRVKLIIVSALKEIHTMTCIRFVPRTTEVDYVEVSPIGGCWSHRGRLGGKQTLSLLQNGCLWRGVIHHEFNHVLGFFHEHVRSDRNKYVRIQWKNIGEGFKDNFTPAKLNNLGLPYDYRSVMHYGKYDFTINAGKPTILPFPNKDQILGQVNGLSTLDYLKINKLYKCNVCSTLLFGDSGIVMTANYPLSYTNNLNCVWLIRASSHQVHLNFYDVDIQSSPHCSKDYVKVYDGDTRASRMLLDKSCGKKELPLLIASTNIMLIEFVSDSSISANGFAAAYKVGKCGATLTAMSGKFSSQFYPKKYPFNTECFWTIVAPRGYRISIELEDFGIEFSVGCVFDYFIIRDGGTINAPLIGRYCGTPDFPSIISTGNYMMVHMYSDDSIGFKGFLAKYTMIPPS